MAELQTPADPVGPVGSPSSLPARVDFQVLVDWLLAGFRLFLREELPSRRAVGDEAQRVLVTAALRRSGSISGAAAVLGTSRRALRDAMKRLGLYERWQARGDAGRRSS